MMVLLRVLNTLADGFGNFSCLTHTAADAALAVANDDQGAEAEITTALDDLGNAVDSYEFFFEFALFAIVALHRVFPPYV